jgi:uncharacterized DUF497 family protein
VAYIIGMEFEWDDAKNSACFERRGFDFAYVVRSFFEPHRTVMQGRRWDYGEDRYRLLGMVDGRARRHLHDAGFRYSHYFGPQGQREGGRKP